MGVLALIVAMVGAVSPNSTGASAQASLVPPGAEKPSFNCAKAKSAAARLICADGELTRLDAELGITFQKKKAQLSPSDQSKFAADELVWIRARNAHCGLDRKGNATIELLANGKPCMMEAISERIAFLAQPASVAGAPLVGPPVMLVPPESLSVEGTLATPQDVLPKPTSQPQQECDGAPVEYNPFKGVADAHEREALSSALDADRKDDYATALRQLRPLAERGRAAAQSFLGMMYAFGQGVPQSYTEAAKWFRLAAFQGDATGAGELANIYYRGLAVPQDLTQAARWSCLAAEQGYAPAQLLLGYMYRSGDGMEQNDAMAVKWFRFAADQGYTEADTKLGLMYAEGKGVTQDYAEALKWYRAAANQGDEHAQALLGTMYFDGRGVTQDYVQAHMWFNLSAAQGSQPAANARDLLSKHMTPAQIAEAQRLASEWRPNTANASSSPKSEPQFPSRGERKTEAISGTAFFVTGDASEIAKKIPSNAQGIALTNAHVVEGCSQIQVRTGISSGAARVVAHDDVNDLALLTTDVKPSMTASWRFSVRQGEDIAVYGFPLAGVLAAGGNIVTGNVTALAGLRDDSRFLQISAPVQPGNSGGPLLDRNGSVLGIVVAKLDALKVVSATGDIPQNVNFAIKASAAAAFLDAQGVLHPESAPGPTLSTPDIAERARKLTMQVVCIR